MEERWMRWNVGDASSFLLFEATGDSEVDGRGPEDEEVPMEEDDAESCSYDSSDWTNADDVGECDVAAATTAWLGDGHEEDEDEFGDEQNSYVKLPGGEYKSCVSVESTSELMNEMEKSKLFWEACLAS